MAIDFIDFFTSSNTLFEALDLQYDISSVIIFLVLSFLYALTLIHFTLYFITPCKFNISKMKMCEGKCKNVKKVKNNSWKKFLMHVMKKYAFIIVQLFFVLFLFVFPRPCTRDLCKEKLNGIMKEMSSAARTMKYRIDEFEYSEECLYYDTCNEIPQRNHSTCNVRVGNDDSCGCIGRNVWNNAGWLNVPDDNIRKCYSGLLEDVFKEKFNDISNEGWIVRNIFLMMEEDDLYLTFPERIITSHVVDTKDAYKLMSLEDEEETNVKCMSNTIVNTTQFDQFCLNDFSPTKTTAYKAHVNKKGFEYIALFDIVDDGNLHANTMDYQRRIFKAIFSDDDVFTANDRMLFARSYEEDFNVAYDTKFFNMYEYAINEITDTNSWYTNSDTTYTWTNLNMVFQNLINYYNDRWVIPYHSAEGVCIVLFLHSEVFDGEMPNVQMFQDQKMWDVRVIIVLLYEGVHPQDQFFRDSFEDFGSVYDYDLGEELNETTGDWGNIWLKEAFKDTIVPSNTDNFEKLWIFPHREEIEENFVLISSVTFNTVTSNRTILGMNIDWTDYKMMYPYCNDPDILYQLEDFFNDTLLFFFQNFAVILLVNLYLIYIFSIEKLVDYFKRKERFKTAAVLEGIYDQYFIHLIILFGVFTVIVIANVDYIWMACDIICIILIFYGLQCCCGVCCLKAEIYKKEKRKSKDVGLRGLSLDIEYIEFDDFIKGTFQNIKVRSGEVTAIMGHSGAGKSTFFNILLGTYLPKRLRVKVTVKDKDTGEEKVSIIEKIDELKQFVGFVPQSEILPERLTVFEQLLMQLKQRFTHTYRDKVDYWLGELGLGGALKNKFPDELSGGQKKRLSVLKELVNDNPIILLDEPTSGLDGKTTNDLIDSLKYLASQGLAICMVIHQPSTKVIHKFDNLYLFLKNKETVKCCEVDLKDKKNINADIVDIFLETPKPYEIKNVYQDDKGDKDDSIDVFKDLNRVVRKRKMPGIRKFFHLFPRCALQEMRDFMGFVTDVLVIFSNALSLILIFSPMHDFEGRSQFEIEFCLKSSCGDLFRDEGQCSSDKVRFGCSFPKQNPLFLQVFMMMFCVGLIALITSLRIFGEEKKNMKREFRSGVNFVSYFITKLIIHLPRMFMSVFFLLVLVHSATCLRGGFIYYFFVCIILYIWVTGQGIFCSLLFPNKEKAVESTLVGIIVVMSSLLFSGVITTRPQILQDPKKLLLFDGMGLLKYFSFAYYGNEALFQVEVLSYALDSDTGTPLFQYSVNEVLKQYGYGDFFVHLLLIFPQMIFWYALGLCTMFWLYTSDKNAFKRWVMKNILSHIIPKFKELSSLDDQDWVIIEREELFLKYDPDIIVPDEPDEDEDDDDDEKKENVVIEEKELASVPKADDEEKEALVKTEDKHESSDEKPEDTSE